jgi:hypothetical protein
MKSTCHECGEAHYKCDMEYFFGETLCVPCYKIAVEDFESKRDGVTEDDYIEQNPMEVPNDY